MSRSQSYYLDRIPAFDNNTNVQACLRYAKYTKYSNKILGIIAEKDVIFRNSSAMAELLRFLFAICLRS